MVNKMSLPVKTGDGGGGGGRGGVMPKRSKVKSNFRLCHVLIPFNHISEVVQKS